MTQQKQILNHAWSGILVPAWWSLIRSCSPKDSLGALTKQQVVHNHNPRGIGILNFAATKRPIFPGRMEHRIRNILEIWNNNKIKSSLRTVALLSIK